MFEGPGPALDTFEEECLHGACQVGGLRWMRELLAVSNPVDTTHSIKDEQVANVLSRVFPVKSAFHSGGLHSVRLMDQRSCIPRDCD